MHKKNTMQNYNLSFYLLLMIRFSLILLGIGSASGIKGWGGSHFGRAPILERFSWNMLDWAYPDATSRAAAIAGGEYVPQNGLPVGIEIWQNKLFVTVPRWRNGQYYYFFFYMFYCSNSSVEIENFFFFILARVFTKMMEV